MRGIFHWPAAVMGPSPSRRDRQLAAHAPGARRRRRLPLRAMGVLATLAVFALALLLVAAALLFRGVVARDLDAIAAAQQAQTRLVRNGLDSISAAPHDTLNDTLRELQTQSSLTSLSLVRHVDDARHDSTAGALAIACLAWLGITSIGALSLLFFSRVAQDIDALRARAVAIIKGERSAKQPMARNDELSDLAQAINSLAIALAQHEADLAIERRHLMHQERLATVGAMAAGILREIGNPIAAIDGHARAMLEARQNSERVGAAPAPCDPRPILLETARLVAITHEIAALAAAPSSQRQLTSLNDVVRQTTNLLRYEPRLGNVAIVLNLDAQLPAVYAIADRLVQLLINLLINAADAVATLPAHCARIQISTQREPEGVVLRVRDNGCGMSPGVRQRAFEPLFTTKPAGCGTGLGLPLCRSIAQEHGGRIGLESRTGHGSCVSVYLPLDAPIAALQ
jgi:two-component system, NtrC family, sensor kinase